ncbi:MAG: methyltransferase domain-containing protein [Anaerolineae bacterium]|nr:methyltransferase domain-containing protein [Anaerolineae bacterium]
MEPVPNWLILWQELAEANARGRRATKATSTTNVVPDDTWRARARTFHESVQRRWAEPDSSREFIIADLKQHPGETLLDIGAGTGAWTVLLAPYVRSVTAMDPSPAMLDVLRENVTATGLDHVIVLEGGWPEIVVTPHAVVLCSHALYGVADFAAFVGKMTATARRRCYLLLRVPTPDSVMAQAARHVWGQPYDSPNFQVAYNALMQLGIFANVIMEDSGLWKPWTNAGLDEALTDIKRRLDLVNDPTHDEFLRDLLVRNTTEVDGQVVWPRGTRSALVYWDVAEVRLE